MSCMHYQSTNPPRERNYFDGQYSSSRYVSPFYSPGIQHQDVHRSGYHTGWRAQEFQEHNVETPTAARGDPSFPDARPQAGRIAASKHEMTTKQADALILERMQTKMRFLEDSNTVMQTRNQNLIAENKVLTSQLEDERSDVKILGKRVESLRQELESEKSRVAETKKAAVQRKNMPQVEANGTSTTNIVLRTDRGVQVWAVCMGCQRKLESCVKQPPTVVITKSELELLEKDMQTLRDTIIAREEAWDKAMEREQTYRQQLTRLTTETITARHLSETRYDELQTLLKTLMEKESELKSHQKDNQCLNKLIAKLYNGHQSCRGQDESKKSNVPADINEKDQKLIEEIVRRVSSAKSKQKPKAKSARSEKNANCSAHGTTSRDKSARPAKDQTGLSRDAKC